MKINHREDYSALIIHEDFMSICGGNLCQSLLLSILEEIISKRKDIFVSLSISDIMKEMYGLYRRDAIIGGLSSLISNGFIERRQLSYTDKRHMFEYRINVELVQEKIDALPDKLELNKVSPLPQALPEPLFNLLKEFGFVCAYCQENQATTWDHIIPRSKHGSEDIKNIVPACIVCNMSKSSKDVQIWIKSMSYTPSAALTKKLEALEIEVDSE